MVRGKKAPNEKMNGVPGLDQNGSQNCGGKNRKLTPLKVEALPKTYNIA